MLFKKYKIRNYEIGLLFREGNFVGLLQPGTHWYFDPLGKVRVTIASQRDPWLEHEQLDVIVKSGVLNDCAVVVDLKQHQRAMVWIDGRFNRVLGPGLYVLWVTFWDVQIETYDARDVRFTHKELKAITREPTARVQLDICDVDRECAGVLFLNGRFIESLQPGTYAFWRGPADARIVQVDLRETMIDISGQDIMTSDKVTLRMNAVATYKIADAKQAVTVAGDPQQALYREVQFALRSIVGTRELDHFLTDKDSVAEELEKAVRPRASELGLNLIRVGIRDVILPGDMKDLMNKVTEAKKAAEANLISRREETAAMRSQANTAKMLADNPTLMRLRELEVLEKIASSGKLNVVLGEKGLADRVVNLL